jgi:TatD DNase family protein
LERGAERVLLHAFDGRAAKAMPAVEAGYFFSVPPSVVRSPQKQKLVRQLPLSCLLLETDSPVLGADPTERNEPCRVLVSLRAIAEIKGLAVQEVADATARNALRLFGLP